MLAEAQFVMLHRHGLRCIKIYTETPLIYLTYLLLRRYVNASPAELASPLSSSSVAFGFPSLNTVTMAAKLSSEAHDVIFPKPREAIDELEKLRKERNYMNAHTRFLFSAFNLNYFSLAQALYELCALTGPQIYDGLYRSMDHVLLNLQRYISTRLHEMEQEEEAARSKSRDNHSKDQKDYTPSSATLPPPPPFARPIVISLLSIANWMRESVAYFVSPYFEWTTAVGLMLKQSEEATKPGLYFAIADANDSQEKLAFFTQYLEASYVHPIHGLPPAETVMGYATALEEAWAFRQYMDTSSMTWSMQMSKDTCSTPVPI